MRCLTCLALLVVLAGCDDNPPPPPPRDSGPGTDAGDVPTDGGADAGPDFDAGAEFDAGPVDSGPPPGDAGMPSCTAAPEDHHKVSTDPGGGDRIVGLAGGGDAFGLIWNETRDGQPDVFARRVPTSGAIGDEQRVTSNFSRENPPALVAVGTNWLATWVDNEGATGFEVRTQLLGPTTAPMGSIQALTSTATLLESNPLLHNMSDGPFALWVEDDMLAGTQTARARTINTDGTARGSTQTVSESGARPGQVALGELASGPVAFWTQGVGLMQDLLMQPLTADGARTGAATTISVESNSDGTVDAAVSPAEGGAVVFGVLVGGVRREVRFRAMNADGTLLGAEIPLFSPPLIGSDASIVSFAGGYAVAFRGDSMDGMGSRIILLLTDGLGNVLDMGDVWPAADSGGRVTLRVTGTGQLAAAWADDDGDATSIHVQVIRCGG